MAQHQTPSEAYQPRGPATAAGVTVSHARNQAIGGATADSRVGRRYESEEEGGRGIFSDISQTYAGIHAYEYSS